jgi:hypothetical protein
MSSANCVAAAAARAEPTTLKAGVCRSIVSGGNVDLVRFSRSSWRSSGADRNAKSDFLFRSSCRPRAAFRRLWEDRSGQTREHQARISINASKFTKGAIDMGLAQELTLAEAIKPFTAFRQASFDVVGTMIDFESAINDGLAFIVAEAGQFTKPDYRSLIELANTVDAAS